MARLYRASTSGRVSRGLAAKSSPQNGEIRLTLTLVCIVAMFLLLVTPSELVNLYFYAARPSNTQLLRETTIVTNALQTANFSFNFILYLAVNSQFRAAAAEVCRWPAQLWDCCRHLQTTRMAMTLETMTPSPAPPPSLAATSTVAALRAVETVNTPTHEQRVQVIVEATDIQHTEHRVMLSHHDDDDDDGDDEHGTDDC